MLKRQKNQIFQAIKDCGYEPSQFEAEQTEDAEGFEIFMLRMKGTPLCFIFHPSSMSFEHGQFQCTMAASGWPLSQLIPSGTVAEFSSIVYRFADWIRTTVALYLEDQNEVDLWAEASNDLKLIVPTFGDPGATELFTTKERQLLRTSIEEVRDQIIKAFEPTKKQLSEINGRLEYLGTAVDRLNRFDWTSLLVNTFLAISIALSLDTARGSELMALFRAAFLGALQLHN